MKRRFFIPEVIQTSAMDCGPAALKALFGGFGVYLSYGRLREACQTDVDGTSIDTLEGIAGQLGMPATQSVLPVDFLLLERSECLPAIAVVSLADGGNHLVVIWRVHGPWIQVMDPAAGRVWLRRQRFLQSLYVHEQVVPLSAFQEWSTSAVFSKALEDRMRMLGLEYHAWSDPAHQDAALRLAGALHARGKLRPGAETKHFLALCETDSKAIPDRYWTARPCDDETGSESPESRGPESVRLRGAVLLCGAPPAIPANLDAMPASLKRVRTEPEPRVWDAAWTVLRQAGWGSTLMIAVAIGCAAFGTVLEALLFRGLFDLGRHLPATAARLSAMLALLVFLGIVLALQWPAALGLCRLGRQLELGLRTRFLSKLPRLDDRYFQSRLISDMAFRAHWLQLLRQLPEIAGHCLYLTLSLLVTGVAIAWVYPGSALLAGLAVITACAVPALFLVPMTERDLLQREMTGSLVNFYRDALLGSSAIKAHGAERTMRITQGERLRRWAHSGLQQQVLIVSADAAQMLITYSCIIALISRQALATGHGPAGLILLVYWAMSIPAMGQEMAGALRGFPALRNTLLRFMEVINAPEEAIPAGCAPGAKRGVKIDFDATSIMVAGHVVLDQVTLAVQSGEHVGIVGISGAGKSSLVGCLLGWYQAASGGVRIDDLPLDASGVSRLRLETAWIDPQVHLFGDTLYENLNYGNDGGTEISIEDALAVGDVSRILDHSPAGLQMPLGEGGTLVSGGEGQRIRAARAFRRSNVRLAILDEPARGLSREQRRRFVAAARRRFSQATLLCVTHDVADTLDFDRVVVIEHGRIVEQGPPHGLRNSGTSRYGQLLDEEIAVARDLWQNPIWRRLQLQGGALIDESSSRSLRERDSA